MRRFNHHISHTFIASTLAIGSIVGLVGCQQKTDEPKKTITASTASAVNTTVIVADTPATLPPALKAMQQLDVPIVIAGKKTLLHPIVTVYTNDKGIVQGQTEDKNGDSNFFRAEARFNYRTNIDNLIFENLETGEKNQLFRQSHFNITRVFFPFVPVTNGQTTKSTTANPKNSNPSNPTTNKTPINKAADKKTTDKKAADKTTAITVTANDEQNVILLPRVIYEVNQSPTDNTQNKESSFTNRPTMLQMGLYMSDDMGRGATRLHPANQYLVSSKWLPELQRLYFITRADSDNNGLLDDKDQVFYYYVDFTGDMPVIRSYRF